MEKDLSQKNICSKKKKKIMFFLLHYCHSFHITFIPSGLLSFLSGFLSFLPDFYHSFLIFVIPSDCCHSFLIIDIPSILFSFLPNYCHFKYLSSLIAPIPSHTQRARKLAGRVGHIREFALNYINVKSFDDKTGLVFISVLHIKRKRYT